MEQQQMPARMIYALFGATILVSLISGYVYALTEKSSGYED
ncbi:MAG: hypothetical protein UX72_C0017G0039 [Parcubacteria group bacterium GW2011_GWA2_47_10]|nr:MAG: hypothetical protein UX72_C0017G0039 [Parcubacteria group bacterium GW2011_GWA2_47_10]